MQRDDATLFDIRHASRLTLDFIENMSEIEFLEDLKTQSAVLHQLMVIGEAVKRLSTNFGNKHTEIPWVLIAGMRDKLIHGYDVVDLDSVWKTANEDMLILYSFVDKLGPSQETK